MQVLAVLVFIVVQIAFLPLALVGVLLVAYKQLFVSKKLGVSSTAIEVINGRWTMAIFGLRPDPATVKFNAVLPNTSVVGLWLALLPLYLKYKISGRADWYPSVPRCGAEKVTDIVVARTLYFDEIINRHRGDVDQFVVMGAGFDTRAYGELNDGRLTFFELDQVVTQRLKVECLHRAGLSGAPKVHFVEVDFAEGAENWHQKLKAAGYDSSKKTLFLWEGVTLYLTEQEVRNTLRELKSHAPEGSLIVADLYAQKFVSGEYMPGMKALLPMLDLTDETLCFGLDFSADQDGVLKTFLASEQLSLGSAYFMGTATKRGTYMVVAEILI